MVIKPRINLSFHISHSSYRLSGTLSKVRDFRGLRDLHFTFNSLRKHVSDTGLQSSFHSWTDEKFGHTCSSIRIFQNEDVDAVLALVVLHPTMLQER
jgi:hypothetical protein